METVQEKPRVGVVLMRTSRTGCSEPEGYRSALQADERDIVARLSGPFEVLGPWIIDSPEALQACQHSVRDVDLDMVLLAYQGWAEDSALVSLLPAIGARPLVVWCYLPWRRLPHPASFSDLQRTSGLVGTFAALGTLRNLGASFLFTFGAPDDPRLIEDLVVAGRAARLRQALRGARFGLIPSRADKMQCPFVDEFRLMADIGPIVQYISVGEFRRVADEIPAARVAEYLDAVRQRFAVKDVNEETLVRAGRSALGLAQLAADAHLDVLAVNSSSSELLRAFGLRPALYPILDEPSATLFQPEGDLGAATANYILRHLTGSPTLFFELYFWDGPKNQIIGGHSGLQNPAIADPREMWFGRDYDLYPSGPPEGAQPQFIAREGRVTLFQLRSTPSGWQAVAASGICLEEQPWLEGPPHAVLRLDASISHFLNRVAEVGVTQHWIMAYGSVLHEIEAFCQVAKIPVELLTY